MLVVSDTATDLVNADQVIAFAMQDTPQGPTVVVAFGANVQSVLCSGSRERCHAALEAIAKGRRERWHLVDLTDMIGPRPKLEVPKIVMPGQAPNGRPA